jgi:hypothetical protein
LHYLLKNPYVFELLDTFIYIRNKLKKRRKEMKKVPMEEEMLEAIKK